MAEILLTTAIGLTGGILMATATSTITGLTLRRLADRPITETRSGDNLTTNTGRHSGDL